MESSEVRLHDDLPPLRTLVMLPDLSGLHQNGTHCPEAFGARLRELPERQIAIFTTSDLEEGARGYREAAGIAQAQIFTSDAPIDEAEAAQIGMPLLLNSATDPTLKESMFEQGHRLVLFGDVHYAADTHHSAELAHLSLQCVGTTRNGIATLLSVSSHALSEKDEIALVEQRTVALRQQLGDMAFLYGDMQRLLRSSAVRHVPVHALGPAGTNIAQVAEKYIVERGIADKAERIVHPAGVEPMQYAEIARQQKEAGVVPLHIECAVYYQMGELWRARAGEMTFADHLPMNLDDMQLASSLSIDSLAALTKQRPLKIASHPSPLGLVRPWLNEGIAEHVKASSNSAAAEMVAAGEADACITTEQGRVRSDLIQLLNAGAPPMLFTFATPLSPEEARGYLVD